MDLDLFKQNTSLLEILKSAKKNCAKKEFSDIVDDAGNQYVDLVMEGGGMLGIALVGYTYVLEQIGIRFLGIGGTSAGSINALLLAALDEPGKPKGEKLLAELANKNFLDFVDGDADARDLINSWIGKAGKFKLAFKAAQTIDNLQENLGLNPGTAFVEWIEGLLGREGIATYGDLRKRMSVMPAGLRTRDGKPIAQPAEELFRLAIIAADVSTETKVEFPKMTGLYWKKPDSVNPALFVRASMSIPYFFHPMRVEKLPRGPEVAKLWAELAGFIVEEEGGVPSDALFVDGGVMSNFPIDIFHNTQVIPKAPTFGVKLELDHRRKNITGPLDLTGAIFNSARHSLDYEFIHRNPDYRRLVTWIPAKGFNWLDFNMSEKDKVNLFLDGARAAVDFLAGFDWPAYKRIREGTVTQALAAKA